MKTTSVPLRPRTSSCAQVLPSTPLSSKSRAFQPKSQMPVSVSAIAVTPCLEHFPEKWVPVFRRKCDQLMSLERVSGSTQSERALVRAERMPTTKALSASACRPRVGDPRWATVPYLDRCVGCALACMRQVLGKEDDRHGFAGARFARRYDIDEAVAGVVAAGLLPAGRDDLGTADLHPHTVRLAPIAVDRVRARVRC